MKGTDCTPEQIESASDFLTDRGWSPRAARGNVTRENVVQLIAWYGALRFQAARDGTGGTFERPGPIDIVTRRHDGHLGAQGGE